MNRQFGGIQKQIESANQELALIEMTTIQKQQILTLLEDLINRGVTEQQIVQLVNFSAEWSRYWSTTNGSGNLQQSNNNPDLSNNGYGGPNRNGGNLSMNDLIRLKTTANMLNRVRMGTTH